MNTFDLPSFVETKIAKEFSDFFLNDFRCTIHQLLIAFFWFLLRNLHHNAAWTWQIDKWLLLSLRRWWPFLSLPLFFLTHYRGWLQAAFLFLLAELLGRLTFSELSLKLSWGACRLLKTDSKCAACKLTSLQNFDFRVDGLVIRADPGILIQSVMLLLEVSGMVAKSWPINNTVIFSRDVKTCLRKLEQTIPIWRDCFVIIELFNWFIITHSHILLMFTFHLQSRRHCPRTPL